MSLTDREVDSLNDWARTQPTLRGVFPYTENRPGLGDRLNSLAADTVTVEETDGDPSFVVGTVKFNRDQFYLTRDTAGNPIVNSIQGQSGVTDHGDLTGLGDDDHPQYLLAAAAVTDHGALTGLTDNDHPQYYKAGDVITAEGFYLPKGEISIQDDLHLVLKADPPGHVLVDDDLMVTGRVLAQGFYLRTPGLPGFSGGAIFEDDESMRVDSGRGRVLILNKSGADVVVGNPGNESYAINLSGSNYASSMKISQIGAAGDNPNLPDIGSLHLHRHSTTQSPGIISSLARSDEVTHSNVADGDRLFSLFATGRVGSAYEVAGRIDITVEGTPSTGTLPGKIEFRTNPGTSDIGITPPVAMTIHKDAHVQMENTLAVKNAVTAENFYLKTGGELITGIDVFVEGDGDQFTNSPELTFNSDHFYLSKTSGGTPMVNFDRGFMGALVLNTSQQTCNSDASATLTWGRESYDLGGWWSSSNPTRLTVPAGVSMIRIGFSVSWAQRSSTNSIGMDILKNGGNTFDGQIRPTVVWLAPNANSVFFGPVISGSTSAIYVKPGDYFELFAYQEDAFTLTLNTLVTPFTNFWIEKIQ